MNKFKNPENLDYQIKSEELTKEAIFLREYTPKFNIFSEPSGSPTPEERKNNEEREETY